MPLTFDQECQAAVDLAKRAVPEGAGLDVGHLISAVYHATAVHGRAPELAPHIPPPAPVRDQPPEKVPLTDALKPILRKLLQRPGAVTATDLFLALVDSGAGRDFLRLHNTNEKELQAILLRFEDRVAASAGSATPPAAPATPAWRGSEARATAIQALATFGRMLTDTELPDRHVVEREDTLRALIKILNQMSRHNAIIVGFPGTGKTALVYELARRILRGDPHLPPRLRDSDIFELSPVFLRSGASMVGQYEERVKNLLEILRTCPRVIMFVDEIHSLFQSGIHDRGPFSDANEAFKAALGRHEITCIGCTTLAEYRRFIEPDGALVRRFGLVHADAPSRNATIAILKARLDRMRAHYAPLVIPESLLPNVVDLTDRHLPALYQPDKSIQLLDAACASCTIAQPPASEVTEEALKEALADSVGYRVASLEGMSQDTVYRRLESHILGQDDILRGIARAFVAGLDQRFRDASKNRPRGVFLFGGPTGVGKTATALELAEILGGGSDALIRVDCNTLQGSGFDSGPALHRLLGVPPGYIGYARGQGGILSRVRDYPRSVVLFDEFEKADPGVGKILLQILDEGRVEDSEGTVLDFSETFIIFTSNAGCVYDGRAAIGFGAHQAASGGPRVDPATLWEDLRRSGLGPEFEGRIHDDHKFFFKALDAAAIRQVVARHLVHLVETVGRRGLRLTWDPDVVEHLVSAWQPHLGARNIKAVVRTGVEEQLRLAAVEGDLAEVDAIHLKASGPATPTPPVSRREPARWREAKTLLIAIG